MDAPKIVLVGEGTAEPTVGFETVREHFAPSPVEFVFGVRRTDEGLTALNHPRVTVVASFPGRGLKGLPNKPKICSPSAYNACQLIASGRLKPDAMLVVATPPDKNGIRSLGAANGPLQSAIDAAPLIFIEEDRDLIRIPGAASIPADKEKRVIKHLRPQYASLSRPPDELDYQCAEHIARLIPDGCTLQIGVGGVAEALGKTLQAKRRLKIVSGSVGSTVMLLERNGVLDKSADILGSAIVGDDDAIKEAARCGRVRMMPSLKIHNPRWLATIPDFYSVNIGISSDLHGNINSEFVGDRFISGKGGAPDFARGAYLSPGGHAIVALRAGRPGTLVDAIAKPTISGRYVSYIVTEKGIADLRGKRDDARTRTIQAIF